MFRLAFLILTLLSSISFFSQESKIPFTGLKESFLLKNEITKAEILFLSNKKSQLAYQITNQNQVIDSMQIGSVNKKYNELIAYTFGKDNATLFYTNARKRELFIQKLSFDSKTTTQEIISFPYNNSEFVTSYQKGDTFYLVSIVPNKNVLDIYVFNNNGEYKKEEISFESVSLLNFENIEMNFYDLIASKFNMSDKGVQFESIDPESYTSLSFASSERKSYIKDGKIILSIDQNPNQTYLFTLDLDAFTYELKTISLPKYAEKITVATNSFILDDKIYLTKISSNGIYFIIKDFNDKLIKEYFTKNDTEIDYKLTPISQLNGEFTSYREIENTNQFIRKSLNNKSAITVYKTNGNLLVTLGAVSQEKPKVMYGAAFGLVGALVYVAIQNPTLNNLDAYANRKVIYFNTLLNEHGNTIKGSIPVLAYEKINNFIKEGKNNYTNFTLSTSGNKYSLGYYNNKTKTFEFKIFED